MSGLVLRERLLDLVAEILHQLDDETKPIDSGLLSLLAHVKAAVDAIDMLEPAEGSVDER